MKRTNWKHIDDLTIDELYPGVRSDHASLCHQMILVRSEAVQQRLSHASTLIARGLERKRARLIKRSLTFPIPIPEQPSSNALHFGCLQLKVRLSFAIALLISLTCFGVPLLAQAEVPRRPNILLILIDDMGYGDLSCYGNKVTATPHVDRLAAEGIRFTQYSAASPICSPSRSGLLTGQYPARWKMTSFLSFRADNEARGMPQWLDSKAPTIARSLQAAGYATGHFGKWHMGGQRDVGEAPLITEYGFDASLTQFEGLGDRVLPLLDGRDGKQARKMPLGVGSEQLGRGELMWEDRARVTTTYVERAKGFIQEAEKAEKPFYVHLWPDDVHSPFFPMALDASATKQARYQAVVQELDAQLGPLFDFVRDDPRRRENTIIVLASDNGPEPGAGSAGTFRGQKATLYEGGVRVPFIVWGPGWVKGGETNETTVLNGVDLRPSLLRLAGLPASSADQPTDGEEMSAQLLGLSPATRTKPLFWIRPPDRSGPGKKSPERWPDLAVREGDWKLLQMEDGSGTQLYDLGTDPGEKSNVAAAQPAVVERLKAMLLEWRKTLPVRLFRN